MRHERKSRSERGTSGCSLADHLKGSLIGSLLACVVGALPAQDPRFEERRMKSMPPGYHLDCRLETSHKGRVAPIVFSPDGTRWAAALYTTHWMSAVIDGEVKESGQDVHDPIWSPDSSHVAFRLHRWQEDMEHWFILLDGEMSGDFTVKVGEPLVFDDGSLAYWRTEGVGAVPVGSDILDLAARLHFGTTSSEVFPIKRALDYLPPTPVQGGDAVVSLMATDQGQRLFVLNRKGNVRYLTGEGDIWVGDWAVRDDLTTMAWSVAETDPRLGVAGQTPQLKIDGKPAARAVAASGVPVMSSDGKRIAYKVLAKDRMGIAIHKGGRPAADFVFVGRPVWDAKAKRVAYAAYSKCNLEPEQRMYGHADRNWRIEGQCVLAVQTVRGKPKLEEQAFERIQSITFSPDGKEVAYAGRRGNGWYVVWGERLAGPFDQARQLVFDEDGKRLGFGIVRGAEVYWRVLE